MCIIIPGNSDSIDDYFSWKFGPLKPRILTSILLKQFIGALNPAIILLCYIKYFPLTLTTIFFNGVNFSKFL